MSAMGMGGRTRALRAAILALAVAAASGACSPDEAATPQPEVAELLDALGYLDYADVRDDEAPDGVVSPDPSLSSPGYNLATYPVLQRAELFDAEGRVLRSWQGGDVNRWERALLVPDGGLLVVVRRPHGLLRFDAGGDLIWQAELPLHHDAALLPDGRIAALTSRPRRLPELAPGPVFDNGVALLSAEGALLEERSLLDVLAARPEVLPLVTADVPVKEGKPLDLFHANYVDWIHQAPAGGDPRFRPGTVLVTLRHQDAVLLFDWERGEPLWAWGRGFLLRPHDARLLPDGRVLIFDNRSGEGWSRIVEVDPSTDRIVWEYRAPRPADFYSDTRGTVQRLPNGNTLVAESNMGRAFEVTPAGARVWEYRAPRNPEGRRPTLRLERYPAAQVAPLLAGDSG